jgi:hypothetical protein
LVLRLFRSELRICDSRIAYTPRVGYIMIVISAKCNRCFAAGIHFRTVAHEACTGMSVQPVPTTDAWRVKCLHD